MNDRCVRTVVELRPRVVPSGPRVRVGAALGVLLATGFIVAPSLRAQDTGGPQEARAERVPEGAIRVDGTLDEPIWRTAPAVTEFVQAEPDEGAAPTDRMEVRFAYDDSALYIGARMFSSAPVQAPLSRRDDSGQAESIQIELDTYFDRRTAYMFGVTAAGVRLDHYHLTDNEGDVDLRFDPVWEVSTTIDQQGWTAEMWIPFTQLRFNEGQEQTWGLNLHRWIPSKNEDDYWVAVPRTEVFWASRFGELHGIRDIDQSSRVEVLPYVAGGSTLRGNADPADPFAHAFDAEGRMGADFKMGVGPNLTLDATITPDFGQVEVDPAVVNLSDTEVIFPERRPFFTEGSALLNGPTTNYFYSRRIGAPPQGRASGDYVDVPDITTILGAAKLTGRLSSGTSVGFLGAVTGTEQARTFDLATQTFDEVRVAPRTLYGVARVQQEFGASGSTASIMATGVQRDLAPGEPLAELVRRHALMVGGAVLFRLDGGAYEISIAGGVTRIDGDSEVILRAQRGNERYFQRPDATHVEVDPTRLSMFGNKTTVGARKVNGTHWLWETNVDFESPELAFNDVGRLGTGDGIMVRGGLTYRETQPGAHLRGYRFRISETSEWNYGGERQFTRLTSDVDLTWSNFWRTRASIQYITPAQDHRLTRGGPSVGTPRGWSSSINFDNNSTDQTRWGGALRYGRNGWGGKTATVEANIAMVPGPRWQLSLGPSYELEVNPRQYLGTRSGGAPATFDNRYIFAFIDRTTLAVEARVNFTLKPDLTLDLYAQPFSASGRYYNLGELPEPRSRKLRSYGTDGTTIERQPDRGFEVSDGGDTFVLTNPDFNVRSFRSTSVLRWEWRPGSNLFVVWQQDRSGLKRIGDRVDAGDLFGSLTASGDNFFAVKASYWLGL